MARKLNVMTVLRRDQIAAHMVRLYLGGKGFDEFTPVEDTDAYVKLMFTADGAALPPGSEEAAVLRTYTVRAVDQARKELAIDFVIHGDSGVAGPWAARAESGSQIQFFGPGSGYRPNREAPWHLLASDEAGLPALAAALEGMPANAVVRAFVEVAGPDDELELTAPSDTEITWVHRGGGSNEVGDDRAGDNAPLIEAVRSAPWLDGEPQVFIHGEAQAVMHNLRRYIRRDRKVSPANANSISGYWRRGRTEEGFREWKAELRSKESSAV